jgi:hypothetical protein
VDVGVWWCLPGIAWVFLTLRIISQGVCVAGYGLKKVAGGF